METYKLFLFVVAFTSLFFGAVLSEQVQSCGGTFTGYQYTIKSPGYPEKYPDDLKCTFTLTGNEMQKRCDPVFYLQFLDFDIQASENCQDEYLLVGDHHIYCGTTQKLKKFSGKDGKLQLMFHTSKKETPHRGFKILVTVECATNYEINSRRNRSELSVFSEPKDPVSVNFNEGTINVASGNNEKLATKKLDKNTSVYFFVPPAENTAVTSSAFRFPDSKNSPFHNKTELLHRNSELVTSGIEPQAQIFDPDSEQPRWNQDQNIHSKLSLGGISDSFHGLNQGPYNTYLPPDNQGFFNSYPNYPNNIPPVYSYSGFSPNIGVGGIGGVGGINGVGGVGGVGAIGGVGGIGGIGGIGGNYPYPTGSECCRPFYSAPRFILASPGFPNFGASPNTFTCGYTIQRSSPQVCNLRLNFKFFNFGSDDSYCTNGFVEVDGQRFCGCRTGLSTVSPFTFDTKIITVTYTGIPRSKFSGFLIEVVQESCNYNYNYNYRYKREISHENEREKRQIGYSYPAPNPGTIQGNFNQQFYIGSTGRNFGTCQARVFFDWVVASKESYLKNLRCQAGNVYARNNVPFAKLVSLDKNDENGANNFGNCETLDKQNGMLSSPGYPANYADNFQKCYRFQKVKGYCRLDFSIFDFDLQPSQNCVKDFINFSGQQRHYCDQSLIGKKLSLDLSKVNSVQMNFKSDLSGNGRGFSMAYEQIAC